jgi:hypothetical protein
MNVLRALTGTTVMTSLIGFASPARAQETSFPPPAAPAEPVPPPAAPASAEPAAPQVVEVIPKDQVKDGIRLRGGFSVNGGVFFLPANPVGGAASIAARVGVQFNHFFSIYYQNTPIIGATAAHLVANDERTGTVVAADYNSLLVNLTLLHVLDVGVGPSLDYLALAKGSISNGQGLLPSISLSDGTGVAAGGHGRVAFHIGGLSGEGPRRSGFAIGVDAHPMFLATGRALSLTAGLGAEWY